MPFQFAYVILTTAFSKSQTNYSKYGKTINEGSCEPDARFCLWCGGPCSLAQCLGLAQLQNIGTDLAGTRGGEGGRGRKSITFCFVTTPPPPHPLPTGSCFNMKAGKYRKVGWQERERDFGRVAGEHHPDLVGSANFGRPIQIILIEKCSVSDTDPYSMVFCIRIRIRVRIQVLKKAKKMNNFLKIIFKL